MRQVRAALEMPRDYAYSRLFECQYIYPTAAPHNFTMVYDKVFLAIDDSLVAAIKREAEDETVRIDG